MKMKIKLEDLIGQRPPVQQTDYSDPQTLKAMVTENYSGIAKKLRRVKHRNAAFYALLDFDKLRTKRRITATLASYSRLREEVNALCPDIPEVFSLDEDWANVNSTPITSLDIQEERLDLTTGAAIWILDRIKAAGQLDALLPLLPQDDETLDEIYMPELWDACHSKRILLGMLAVLRWRNQDCTIQESDKRPKSKHEPENRIFSDCWTAAGTQHQNVPSRRRFEAVLALIPEADRQAAARHYEEKLWEWVKRYYRCRALFAAREQKLAKSFDRIFQRARMIAREQQTALSHTKAAPAVCNSPYPAIPAAPVSRRSSPFPNTEALIQTVHSLTSEVSRLDTQSDNLTEEINNFIFDTVSNIAERRKRLETLYGPEIAEILSGFEVDDPYELCFAALWLLDNGSDLPWLYFANGNLMEHVGNCLPWANGNYKESFDDIWNPSEDGIQNLRRGPRRGRTPEIPDWYHLDYIDKKADPDFQKRNNLAQIIYDLTGCLMPRQLHRYDAALGELACYGITGSKTLPFLYCMVLMGEARRQSLAELPEEELTENEAEEEIEADILPEPVPDIASSQAEAAQLRERLDALKQENSRLKHAIHSALRDAEVNKNQYAALLEQTGQERRELAELREIIFRQQSDFEPPVDAGIEFPYSVGKRTVVFGGHDSWARAIKPMLTGDIRFIDRNMLPNTDLIRHADIVWLQTNSLSHKFYNKIMDVVRNYDIPVHYFKFASAEKCAEQVVLQDQD